MGIIQESIDKIGIAITQSDNIEELKYTINKLISYISILESQIEDSEKYNEKLSERIMFIENCLQDNSKKLNLDSLRL